MNYRKATLSHEYVVVLVNGILNDRPVIRQKADDEKLYDSPYQIHSDPERMY